MCHLLFGPVGCMYTFRISHGKPYLEHSTVTNVIPFNEDPAGRRKHSSKLAVITNSTTEEFSAQSSTCLVSPDRYILH